ncbi:MAG: hypothetical protein M3R46_13930 [Actinomycetota bacterium]|nr:hypothetical protein [Actinomycetota bacterium]
MSPAALELTIDGRRIASSTQEQRARPYTAVIATATPELALRLHSTYGGSEHFTFLARWPSRRATQHAGERVRELTARERLRLRLTVERVVEELNRFLRGQPRSTSELARLNGLGKVL